jgi:hypothetical protein
MMPTLPPSYFPEWYTAQQLAGLPGMPSTADGVRYKANNENWEARKKEIGKGYEYHIDSFSVEARTHLILQHTQVENERSSQPVPEDSTVDIPVDPNWNRYRITKQVHRDAAHKKVRIVHQVEALIKQGFKVSAAVNAVAKESGESRHSIERWRNAVKKHDCRDWVALLTPKYDECSGGPRGDRDEAAWEFYKM